MYNQNKIYKQTGQLRSKESGRQTCSSPVWQSPRTLGIERTLESTTTKAECTLESGCSVLYSTSYPGVAYSRVRPTRVWRLEYVLPGCGVHCTLREWVVSVQLTKTLSQARIPSGSLVSLRRFHFTETDSLTLLTYLIEAFSTVHHDVLVEHLESTYCIRRWNSTGSIPTLTADDIRWSIIRPIS